MRNAMIIFVPCRRMGCWQPNLPRDTVYQEKRRLGAQSGPDFSHIRTDPGGGPTRRRYCRRNVARTRGREPLVSPARPHALNSKRFSPKPARSAGGARHGFVAVVVVTNRSEPAVLLPANSGIEQV